MKTLLVVMLLLVGPSAFAAQERPYAFSLYGGQLTGNHWEDFFLGETVDSRESYLLAATLARRVGGYEDLLSYEVEGQLVKHFHQQNHWEFNLLGVVRWEPFWWDKWLDTSVAFGLGSSYATEKPQVEIANDGETSRFLVYWMLELAVTPVAARPELELFTRIHHRSNAYGLIAGGGGSNALAGGLRYRF